FGSSFSASSTISGSAVIGVLEAIEALIRNANKLVGLLAILGKGSHAVVHADAHSELQGVQHLAEEGFHAAAEGESLFRIGLRQQQRDFVTADTKRRIGGAQRFL